ncbi:MAG: hypothetical protein V7756_06655 [Halopseudomonas sp.]|uniref:hypothetical protein n=1 Tax=Halopseudomonas sp. TaxID=2901191 RepID=UPI00300115AD
MSTVQPNPNGNKDIIGSLREKLNATVLPITPAQRERLLHQLGSEMLSLSELTQALMSVPVAALHICRAAGEAARNRDIDILTLEQACSLLGTQRLGTLLGNIPVVAAQDMPRAYLQLLSISEHAVSQAQGLFSHRIARLWHEMALATLLFLSPLWALTYVKPHIFAQWDALNRGVLPEHVSKRQIAETTASGFVLVQQLAQDWWLPPWILQGYRSLNSSRRTMVKALHIARNAANPQEQQAHLDADRELYRWLTQPANSLLMATGIALGSHHNWYAVHTLRWQQLSALYLGCSVHDTQRTSHESAVLSAHQQSLQGPGRVWLPALSLPWPADYRTTVEPAAKPASLPAAATPPAPIRPERWRHLCMTLNSAPSPFSTLPELLSCGLAAMHDGLGLPQCWIALFNGKAQQLVVGAALGFAAGRNIVGTRLGNPRGSAWGTWLMSETCHHLDSERLTGMDQVLPGALKTIISDSAFELIPIVHNKQVLGLLFACNPGSHRLMDQQRQKALSKTASCICTALINFKQRS